MAKSSSGRRARAEIARLASVAKRLLQAGNNAAAIEPLSQLAQLLPGDASVHNDLGLAYRMTGRLTDAVRCHRRARELQPDLDHAHFNLGLALADTGDDDGAIDAYRKAVSTRPDNVSANVRLADLLWENGIRSEAVACYERAAASVPDTTLGRRCRAIALSANGYHAEAERELQKALSAEPNCSETHALLGRVLLETGRFEDAIKSLEHAIELDPGASSAYQGIVTSRRLTTSDRGILERILACLDDKRWTRLPTARADRHRMTLHFAAGKAFDDLSDYQAAMRHFDAANEIRSAIMPPFDRHALQERLDRIIAQFTPKLFADAAAIGDTSAAPLLIVGMPRSGTTMLERIVSSHPRVHGCGELDYWIERAPPFLGAPLAALAAQAASLREDYLRVLRAGAPEALRATDKMTFNFLWIGLIHLLFPNACFVESRRHPIDTCLSIYTTPLFARMRFVSRREDLVCYYKGYARLMAHWRSVIPRDRLLQVDYEDIVADPERKARQVIAFAGLEWDAACMSPSNNRAAVGTASLWQARQPIYRSSVERWRRYEPWIGALSELLPADAGT